MGKTYRRKNAYNRDNYVDSYFEDNILKYEFLKDKRSFRSIEVRSAYYHSDNYKPFKSNILKLIKKETNFRSRTKSRNNLKKIHFILNFEDFYLSDKVKMNKLSKIYL